MDDNQDSSGELTGGLTTVSYMTDEHGEQQAVSGYYWRPVDEVNHQAWQEIEKDIEESRRRVENGERSCLHYHMTVNLMDPGLLARYTGQPTWLVRLHLRPWFFRRLAPDTLQKYAILFRITVKDLVSLEPGLGNPKKS